jgi:P-type Cu+ transporter
MRTMALQSETIQVAGIRCEGCVQRLGAALEPLKGLEAANANLVGQVTLSWDDERLARDDILRTLERAGFAPAE